MWPWEHLLFGYVLYSVVNHTVWHRPISDEEGVVVALATQAPDLVDKPLSWSFGLVATGYGPAHSLLVGFPVVALVTAGLWARDRARLAAALVVAYSSHLVGDALALRANGPTLDRLLWPLSSYEPYESDLGFVERFADYFGAFVARTTNPENLALTLGYAAVLGSVVVLWVVDGTPGVRWVRRRVDLDR